MDDSTRPHLSAERLLELGDLPIDDDASLLERARSLIRAGFVRRLWLLVLDADGIMVPPLAQIDETPVTPEADATAALGRLIGGFADAGCSVAIVLERPGPPWPSPDDWAWHDVIRRAAAHHAAAHHDGALRGVLLAHSRGIDLLQPDAELG